MRIFRNIVAGRIVRTLATSSVIALLFCSLIPAAAAPLAGFQEKGDRSTREPADKSASADKSAKERGSDKSGSDGGDKGKDTRDSGRDKCDGKDHGDKGGPGGKGGK